MRLTQSASAAASASLLGVSVARSASLHVVVLSPSGRSVLVNCLATLGTCKTLAWTRVKKPSLRKTSRSGCARVHVAPSDRERANKRTNQRCTRPQRALAQALAERDDSVAIALVEQRDARRTVKVNDVLKQKLSHVC